MTASPSPTSSCGRSSGATARSSSAPARAPERPRCSWSASCEPCSDDGVGVDEILAITFTDKAAAQLKSRVQARFADLNRPLEARAARVGVDLHHPRLLRAAAARARSDGRNRSRVPGARRRRVRAARARRLRPGAGGLPWRRRGPRAPAADRRLHARPAGGHGPHRLRAPAQPRPRRAGAARDRSTPRRRRARGPGAGGRRPRSRRSAPPRARRWPPRGRSWGGCTALLDRLPAADVAEAPELKGLVFGTGANALKGDALRGVPRRPRRLPAACACATASTWTTCCCATSSGAYGRPLRGSQARPLGPRLRRPAAAARATSCATTACASTTPGASPT